MVDAADQAAAFTAGVWHCADGGGAEGAEGAEVTVDPLGGGQAASAAAPAGQVTLSPAAVLTVLGALRDGARWNDYPPGDPALAARYRSLARSLGDDR